MTKKSIVLRTLAIFALTFSVLATGCKKEEAKVETAAPAPTQEKAAAPQATSGDFFKAEIAPESVPLTVKKGSKFEVNVKVKNLSGDVWPAKDPQSVRLSYHWREAKTNKAVVWDGKRTVLAKDLSPNEEATLIAKVEVPGEVGNYFFEIDMVQEKVGWFGKKGSEVSRHKIEVK